MNKTSISDSVIINNKVYLVMGVMAAGKSSIASDFCQSIDGQLIEADDLHSDKNKSLMSKGISLTDEDRWPWLQSIAKKIKSTIDQQDGDTNAIKNQAPIVIACSALRQAYRDYLRQQIGKIVIVYLHATPELIAKRVAGRTGHFMSPDLIKSQFSTLEAPNTTNEPDVVTVDIDDTRENILSNILEKLNRNI